MRHVLVIRSARADLLRRCLAWMPADARVTTLGARVPGLDVSEWVDAPAGPLSWRALNDDARVALRSRRWDELVILHNLGDDDYGDIVALARRIAPLAPLRVYYADAVEHRHHSALALGAHRAAHSALASVLLGLLMVVTLPLVAARTWRS